ncbi:hypothetical protein CORC01_03151 [Colletotrichum orchidophilum]|uniref:Uncharacterized protein n=1 Tax=Colletotrichum orchidophilum TaxID=1209926 RepID=A0A1G4BJQ4_9PEZI|nr:uncharacterized protein CORC01_03151 [Colletotrichum orchidophilum]OHF01661.1 hypothetical protein CORC01_03151 [Colletotrichum orchidophilum]
MGFFQLTLFTLLATQGLAAPTTTRKPGFDSLAKEDPVIAAGKTPPFNPLWHYCQMACRCEDLKEKDRDASYFQCITNPNCEQCERVGMKVNPPPSLSKRLV